MIYLIIAVSLVLAIYVGGIIWLLISIANSLRCMAEEWGGARPEDLTPRKIDRAYDTYGPTGAQGPTGPMPAQGRLVQIQDEILPSLGESGPTSREIIATLKSKLKLAQAGDCTAAALQRTEQALDEANRAMRKQADLIIAYGRLVEWQRRFLNLPMAPADLEDGMLLHKAVELLGGRI